MLTSLRCNLASSPAISLLRRSCWKSRLQFSGNNTDVSQTRFCFTTADAMFLREVQKHEGLVAKKGRKSAVDTQSTSSKTVVDMLKGASQSPQTGISGLTKNKSTSRARNSSYSRSPLQNTAPSTINIDNEGSALKRTSSEINRFAAALSNAGSFQEVDHVIGRQAVPTSNAEADFDSDDFEDDFDLNPDIEYPETLPALSNSRKSLRPVSANLFSNVSTAHAGADGTDTLQSLQSSTLSWSSSPQFHKLTPPSALQHKNVNQSPKTTNPPELVVPNDADVHPTKKRRTLPPWSREKSEERAFREYPERKIAVVPDTENTPRQCYKCGQKGHMRSSCTNQPARCSKCQQAGHIASACNEGSPGALAAAISKGKNPWNTTASAVKAQQKAFKNMHKMAKNSESSLEDMHAGAASRHRRPAPIFLSEEQKSVSRLVIEKKQGVFFTGSAGTGKSVLIRSIISDLRRIYAREPDRVAVTASTGLAACNIGGVTLHSFGGIGLGKESSQELVKKIQKNIKAKTRWLRTKVLIIDEISMVDGELFDKLESIAKTIRKSGMPFGGIQLVVTGDFFQLPPVPDHGTGREVKFAFDAATWPTVINHTIGLTEVFRQKDPVFANMLNEMRLGGISEGTLRAFKALERTIRTEDSLEATELFPTRHEVDNANGLKMRNLQGKTYEFMSEDGGSIKDLAARDRLLSNCMAPQRLVLKKGAQVMLIKNIDDSLVNGSIGNVIAFMSDRTFEIYDNDPDLFDSEYNDELKLDGNFLESKKKLQSLMNKNATADTAKLYPMVRFVLTDGTSRALLCHPEDWKVELPNGEVQASRRQIPLILAWALSIHKAQGQTLQRVKVDLRKVFEKGQAYVALSRATCREGLQVIGFDKRKVMVHPRVVEFYNSLYNANSALKHPRIGSQATKKEQEMKREGRTFDEGEAALEAYG